MKIDKLLKEKPYGRLGQNDFLSAMREALNYHYKNSEYFRKFLNSQNFNPNKNYAIQDIPFLPVAIFKELWGFSLTIKIFDTILFYGILIKIFSC